MKFLQYFVIALICFGGFAQTVRAQVPPDFNDDQYVDFRDLSFLVNQFSQYSIFSLNQLARSFGLPLSQPTLTVTPTSLPNGIVGAYSLNQGSGLLALDRSPSLNHATLINEPTWVANGKYGGALQFDGLNDYLLIADSNSLDLTQGMTLEAWVKPTAGPTGWTIVLVKQHTSFITWGLYSSAHTLGYPEGYAILTEGTANTASTAVLPLNTWTHLALTYDQQYIRIYINGIETGNRGMNGPILTTTGNVVIGGNASSQYFTGLIDEVRIFNTARTPNQILTDSQTPL